MFLYDTVSWVRGCHARQFPVNNKVRRGAETSVVALFVCLQMFERETKREKILEARQREIRLKERSRSEQSREEEGGREEGEESPDQLIARAENNFFSVVETELRRRREKEDEENRVMSLILYTQQSLTFCSLTFTSENTKVLLLQ